MRPHAALLSTVFSAFILVSSNSVVWPKTFAASTTAAVNWYGAKTWRIGGVIRPTVPPPSGQLASTPIVINHPQYYQVMPTVQNGHYVYSYEVSAAPHTVVATFPIYVDPQSHSETIEVGIPSAVSVSMMAHVPNMHTTVTPATSGSNPSTSSAPDPTTFNAYFETGWNDPLSLSVGIVWTYMTFSWNGADVNSWTTWGSYQTPIPDEDYFYNISHGGYYGDGYTEATGWMDATEDAPLFANTKIYWEPNAINVGGSGWITGFVNTWTNGPDAWMLHGPWSILNNGTTN